MSGVWPDEPGASGGATGSPLSLWRYVLLFALVLVLGALLTGMVMEHFEVEESSAIRTTLIIVAAIAVCDRFAFHRRRLFYVREARRMILYALCVLLLVEAVVLVATPGMLGKRLGAEAWLVVILRVGLNAFVVWLAFRVVGRAGCSVAEGGDVGGAFCRSFVVLGRAFKF